MMRTRADNNQIVGRTTTESVQLQSSTRVRRPVQWQKKNAILIEKDRRHQINVSSSMLSPDVLLQIFRSKLSTTINMQISGFYLFRLLKGLVFRLLNGFVQSYESSPTQIRIPCPIVQVMRKHILTRHLVSVSKELFGSWLMICKSQPLFTKCWATNAV